MTLCHRSIRLACLGLSLTAALSSLGQTPTIPPTYKAAADVTITTAVAAPNPGGFTATFQDPPIENLLAGGEYEGFNFRDRFYAGGDGVDTIPVDAATGSAFDSRREGFFDGATARVYRIINGKLTSIRQAKVTKHRASGWEPTLDNKVVPPDRNSYQWNFDGYNSPVAPYYFAVVAVAEDGSRSAPSDFVEVKRPEKCETKAVNDGLKDFNAPEAASVSAPGKTLPAPANFKSATAADGVVTFTWDPVNAPGIAGYLVLRSDYEPSKHLGYGYDLADKATGPEQHVKKGDLVFFDLRRNSWNRNQYATNRVWDAYANTGLPEIYPGHPGESTNHTWTIEAHPGPFPAEFTATERGRGALKVTMTGNEEVALKQYNYAGPQQNYYAVLKPGRTYVVEFWARPEGMQAPSIRFELNQIYNELSRHDFALSPGEWKKYSYEFAPDKEFPADNENVGQMILSFKGPGTLWLDAWRVFPKDTGYMKVKPAEIEDLRNSGMAFVRTHGFVKSGWSYFLEDLTNAPGVLANRGVNSFTPPTTLFSALEFMKQAGVNPWLQIEMSLDEKEWLGFVEYLAAPYDPAKDSPQSKPWAFKRYSMGQQKPWTDVFPKFIFEVSNEQWNPFAMAPWNFPWQKMTDGATGRVYEGGELSGLMTGYIQSQLKKSPYWSALGPKMETVTGGWLVQLDDNGFGQQAVKVNPDIQHNLVANYNGGWDEGAAAAEASDYSRRLALTVAPQYISVKNREFAETRDRMAAKGVNFKIGTYEAGPGYALPGSISNAQVEAESVIMKSLAAGTGTLDCFLDGAQQGLVLQNFFTYSRGRHFWTSHAEPRNGGQAYPSWLALSLYNRLGQGDFLVPQVASVPTDSLPGTNSRAPLANAPLTGVYATRDGDRYSVFVLSRKLDNYPYAGDDGYTPVRLNLPFTSAKKISLFTLEGNPRDHNLDSEKIKIASRSIPVSAFNSSFVLNAERGADARGLPPGAVYLYVFEGTTTPELPKTPSATVVLGPGQTPTTSYPAARFQLLFDRAIKGITADKIKVTGTAGGTVKLEQPTEMGGTGYLVTVEDLETAGTVSISVSAGAGVDAAGSPTLALTSPVVNYALSKPLDKVFVFENFDAAASLWAGETGSGWKGKWELHNEDIAKFPDFFKLTVERPLTGAVTPGYLSTGGGFLSAWRVIDIDNALSFVKLPAGKDQAPQAGLKGATLWLSFLVRKESIDNNHAALSLNSEAFYKEEFVAARFGYFGNESQKAGGGFWSMQVRNPANQGWQNILSAVPVEPGKTDRIVARITFGTKDKFDLYVNPSAGIQPPAEPAATFTSDGSRRLTFDKVVIWGGDAGTSAFDEIRFGDSYKSVTTSR